MYTSKLNSIDFAKIADEMTIFRRMLHSEPEIAFEEVNTAAAIAKLLQREGISFTEGIAKTGIVATIKGERGKSSKTLLLRADIDALPINEDTDVPYKSRKAGLMHGCGHDIHTSVVLGSAIALNRLRDEFSGYVKILFQPAEEGVGGALPMINEGVLESPKVTAAIACHVAPLLPVSSIQASAGVVTGSPDHFTITLTGKGGHGAIPQQCADPILAGAHIVVALQHIVSRNIDPMDSAVITVGTFNGGYTENIIPEKVVLKGTARTLSKATREFVRERITFTAKHIAETHGVDCDVDYCYLYPPCVNDSMMTDLVRNISAKLLGADKIEKQNPAMIGEDFAYFAEKVPSCFFYLGCGYEDRENFPLHSSKFNPDDSCIPLGIDLFVNCALEYLC